jgi:Domain of unknown function (DUF4350)
MGAAALSAGSARGWRALHPAARAAIVVVAVVIAVNVALQLLDATTRGADETAPRSSSLSTGRTGAAAWAELLERRGHRVDSVRGSLGGADLDHAATLVVLDPDDVSDDEARAVSAFVEQGGRLVAGGGAAVGLLRAVLDEPPAWAPDGVRRARPEGPAPEVDGLGEVVAAGDGSWGEVGGTRAVLGDGTRTLATVADVGSGRLVMLADSSALQNRLLDRAGNAALALQVVGEGRDPVAFAEGQHGYGDATGLGAIPGRWKTALIGLALAALVGAVAAGRRLGPPEDEPRPLPPPRRAYVDALAATLGRARRPAEALAPLQAATRARLARRAGLGPDASEADLRAAAARLAFPADEIDALFAADIVDDDEMLAAGRALARVERAR